MAVTKEKKKEVLSKLEDILKSSTSVVFVNFHGLEVSPSNEMRNSLREEKVGYVVAKKTLVKRALEGVAPEGEMPELEGELALAYGDEPTVPAQKVQSFAKKYKDSLSIIGGIFEGTYKSKEEMVEIASIPSLNVLRGQFANVINSPIQGLVVALGQVAEKRS
ncbi:MAG: 50S ribosomal protein L10 [Candidatus Paceibacterota bacterium]